MQVSIDGRACCALIDSGATISVLRTGLHPSSRRRESTITLTDVRGRPIPVHGMVEAELQAGEFVSLHSFVVADIMEDVILGADFLEKHSCLIDWGCRTLTLGGHSLAFEISGGVLTAPAHLSRVKTHERPAGDPVKALPETLQTVLETGSHELDARSQARLAILLGKYQDAFSLAEDDNGRTSLARHTIDVGDARPIKQAPRPVPLASREVASQEVQRMLRQGVIEPSNSPWSSPVVLVKKKDGSTRFCVDYRRLNEVTKKDSHPLPRIDLTLDALSGARWFSTLDLKSGYWQLEVHPEDREKTAFSLGGGLWQFSVLPFGLCNAPATFERLMEMVLQDLLGKGVLVYLDDVIVYAPTLDQEFRLLETVFQRLREAGLKLHPKKCRLFQKEVVFLGHIVGSDGIHTDPAKVEAVKDWPRPKNIREVSSFLGFCNYYRRFVRGFSDIAAPLHQMKGQRAPFRWSDECENAFQTLKRGLTDSHVLAYPREKEPFVLDTDASNTGVGAVLSQIQDGEERVIGYYSSRLDGAQRRYCVTRRELLAVVKAFSHFRPYLYGQQFTLRTDHSSLQWLMNFRDPEGQWARWLQRIQEYDFKILHRPGKKHSNADGLSRRPCDCKACQRAIRCEKGESSADTCCETLRQVTVLPVALADSQQKDPDLQPILKWMAASPTRPGWREMAATSPVTKAYWTQWDTLQLKDGVLYRAWFNEKGDQQQLLPVLPKALQEEALRQLHDNPAAGHFGRKKTYQRVCERFYWVGRRTTVEDWCRRCDICASRMGPHRRRHGPAQIYLTGAAMERVAVDILGPLPKTESGNRYILVAMDYFTKWPEAYPIPNQEAVTVAKVLVEGFFTRFGVPLELHSDQGRNFESAVFQETCRLMGVHKTRTTPAYPQSDGMVERYNRTLLQHLSKCVSEQQRDWETCLPFALMAYRSAIQEATGVSPCRLMLGRELRLPADLVLPRPLETTPRDVPHYVEHLQDTLQAVQQTARTHLQQSADRMKIRYDREADNEAITEGTAVWYYNPRVKKGRTPKLARPWTGPFKVMGKVHEGVYRIQQHSRARPRVVNRARLWRYQGELAPDWWHSSRRKPTPPESDEEPPEECEAEEDHCEEADEQVYTRRGRRVRRPSRLWGRRPR